MRNLSSGQSSPTALAEEGSESLAGQLDIMGSGLPRSLLERVQHIDSLREPGHVQHAMGQRRVNSNLASARPNDRHRLPLQRVQTLLNTPELNTRQSAGIPGEGSHIPAGSTEPLERLVGHHAIYEYSYVVSSSGWTSRMTTRWADLGSIAMFPVSWTALEVGERHDDDLVLSEPIDHLIREALDQRAPRSSVGVGRCADFGLLFDRGGLGVRSPADRL
jgi:hypothetical protein